MLDGQRLIHRHLMLPLCYDTADASPSKPAKFFICLT